MIYTITLHPAMDKLIFLDQLEIHALNRAERVYFRAGGKGINVSREVRRLGAKTTAMGFLSGETGRKISRMLLGSGVPCDFVEVAGETRTNSKIIDTKTGRCTEINECSPALSPEDLKKLEDKLRSVIKEGDIVIFSGSAPAKTPSDVYKKWILLAKELGAMTILDADEDLLLAGMEAHPTVVKPNLKELSVMLGEPCTELTESVIRKVQNKITKDMRMVFLTMGPEGAALIEKDRVMQCPAPDVTVVSTVGAGDAMVAAIAVGLQKGYASSEILKMTIDSAARAISDTESLTAADA